MQKLEVHKSVVAKSKTLKERQKEHWLKVMTKQCMSSEESGEEDIGDEITRLVIFIKQLKWRSAGVTRFFKQTRPKARQGKI